MNPDFDYRKYLDTLAADGLNLTRLFVGTYYEKPGDFGIGANTLAPAPGRALVPWARSETPGAADGGSEVRPRRGGTRPYFERAPRSFVAEAGKRGIVVEIVLFSSYYGSGWSYSPLNAANNVNGTGAVPREKANTLDNGNLLAEQERVVRRIVAELRELRQRLLRDPERALGRPRGGRRRRERVRPARGRDPAGRLLEEPGGPRGSGVARLAGADRGGVTEEEDRLGVRHLLAQNYGNHRYPVRDVDPAVDILNFHYAWPEAVTLNGGLGRVVSFDETGFASPIDRVAASETDAVYRRQAWEFLMAGGGIFSMLDYSFTVGHEDGTFVNRAPGGGSPALRRQLRVLKDFLESLDIPDLKPRPGLVESAPGAFTRAIGTKKRRGVYVRGDGRTTLALDLPKGDWREEWIDTKTGASAKKAAFAHEGGRRELASPPYERDVALRLVRGDGDR